jgi:hypothetical protein
MAHHPDPLSYWQPWQPQQATQFFSQTTAPWWIAGGWAIDLFLGKQTREHQDIDILFLRRDQQSIRLLLQGWDVQEAHPTSSPDAWPFREWKHDAPLPPEVHDIWCRPRPTDPWTFQFMVIDTQNDQWLFRRNTQIRGSLSSIGALTPDGIPYLAPEIQLLYKSRALRPKDKADFTQTLPYLKPEQRQWLAQALTIEHSQHPWISRLAS